MDADISSPRLTVQPNRMRKEGFVIGPIDSLSSDSAYTPWSSISLLDIERGAQHENDADKDMSQQVAKACSRRQMGDFWTLLRLTIFTTYRQLLAIICVANLIGIVILILRRDNDSRHLLEYMATASVANLTVSILVRQDYIRNMLFHICWNCPHSAPLWLRKKLALVYENGGMHSGGAICAVAWFIVFAAFLSKQCMEGTLKDRAVLTLVYALLAVFLSILVTSIPQVRRRHHNLFENTHRLGGWAGILLFWPTLVLFARASAEIEINTRPSLGTVLARQPSFWILLVLSAHIIYPWLSLRKVAVVKVDHLSTHAVRIYFSSKEKITPLHGLSISDSPLREWHSFAAIPDLDGSDGGASSCIISKAGDWTAQTVTRPAGFYWMRGMHMAGTLAMARVFRSVVIMATGSGVGPCMYFLGQCPSTKVRIIWSAPSPRITFGDKIYQRVLAQDPEAVVIDTRNRGQRRPDLISLAESVYHESGAEAVFFISNQKLTKTVVEGLKMRDVPIFAPIFDS